MVTVRSPQPHRDSAGKELSQNSSKLKAQNQDKLRRARQTQVSYTRSLNPKILAQDEEARPHATMALIQIRWKLSGDHDNAETA